MLVILSNKIPLNLSIAFTYQFILISLLFQFTKSHLFIKENWFFYIILLKNISAHYFIVENYIIYHPTLLELDFPFFFFYPSYNYYAVSLIMAVDYLKLFLN